MQFKFKLTIFLEDKPYASIYKSILKLLKTFLLFTFQATDQFSVRLDSIHSKPIRKKYNKCVI